MYWLICLLPDDIGNGDTSSEHVAVKPWVHGSFWQSGLGLHLPQLGSPIGSPASTDRLSVLMRIIVFVEL